MTPYPLSRTDKATKVLITMFLATIAVSIGVAELNVNDKVRFTDAGVVARYGPEEAGPPTPAPGPDDFPLESGSNGAPGTEEFPLESGSNAAPASSTPPVTAPPLETLVSRMNTFTLLLDVTHPHVFELPLVMFVLAHFLMRTRVPDWFKLSTYAGAFAGIAAFLGTPWLVRYASVAAAPLLLVGACAIGITGLVMIVVPIVDMWMPPAKRSPKPAAGDAATADGRAPAV
jgi:hypothetical protein